MPGATHDLTATQATGLLPTLDWITSRGVVTQADKAYRASARACSRHTKGRDLTDPYREANRRHAAARSIGERGVATEKNRRLLRRYRADSNRVSEIVTAVRILEAIN